MTPAISLPWGASPTWRWLWDFPHCSCVEARLWLVRLLGKPQAHGILSHRHTRMHLHACICTYTHWSVHTHTHTHTHIYTLIASFASLGSWHTCVHTLTGAYTHTHTHLASSASLESLHTYVHILTDAYTHTHTHTHTPCQFYISRIPAHVYIHSLVCVYTHTHTHTHTHTPPQFCIPRIPACNSTTSSFSCLLCLLFPVFLPELLEDQEELKKAFLVCGVGRKALTTEDYQGIL